jgi:hypothetical protein
MSGDPANDFDKCLSDSHRAEDWPGWEVIYRQAFPDFHYMCNHRLDGTHQREGIDRSIITTSAQHILVDEKVRSRNKLTGRVYDDIALEIWSDIGIKSEGWVQKKLRADYIAYAILPLGVCYLLPVRQLQEAWKRNEKAWKLKYRTIAPESSRWTGAGRAEWTTLCICVPAVEVLNAIRDCLTVRFDPVAEIPAV